jgi:hypothetical protein
MSVTETEVFENSELNEIRSQYLTAAETIMRECLKKLSFF